MANDLVEEKRTDFLTYLCSRTYQTCKLYYGLLLCYFYLEGYDLWSVNCLAWLTEIMF